MRVLHVINYFYPAVKAGGTAFAIFELARGLAHRDIEVVIYTSDLDVEKRLDVPTNRPVDIEGIRVFYHPVWGENGYLFSPPLWRKIHHEISQFDLVHLHETWTFPILIAAYYCRRYGIPYVISPHGTLDAWCVSQNYLKKKMYFECFARSFYQNAEMIHFTTRQERDNLSPKIPFQLGSNVVIPCPIDLEDFEKLPEKGIFRRTYGIPEDQPIILFVGRLHRKKGLELLLRAFSRIDRDAAVLVIVGPDEEGYQRTLETLVARASLGDRVIFTGVLRGRDKLAAYWDSTLLALPSFQENFGMVVAEAMAAGLPVVISPFVNISEEVGARGAGLVLPLEEERWGQEIANLLQNPQIARTMGLAGRELVTEKYRTDRVVDRMIEIYRSVITPNESRCPNDNKRTNG